MPRQTKRGCPTVADEAAGPRCAQDGLARRQHGADLQLVHHSDAGSQYTSLAFQQVLDDDQVLQSIGSVGDAFDNSLAESFVDTFRTELIADRAWRIQRQLEPAIVERVAWLNTTRLHQSLGDLPRVEFEALYGRRTDLISPSLWREGTFKSGLRGIQPASRAAGFQLQARRSFRVWPGDSAPVKLGAASPGRGASALTG